VINLEITITTTDGETFSARPNTGTIMALEEHFHLDSGITAIQQMNLKYFAWLAWEKRRHDGHTMPPFERFRLQVEDMDFEVDTAPLAGEEAPTG
jgi:hypothetical protein